MTDENPLKVPVLRMFHGQDVKEYHSPDEIIAYGIIAADYRVACRNKNVGIIGRF